MANKTKIVNPGAQVIIYNYVNRFGTENVLNKDLDTAVQDVDQIILNSVSLLNVQTSKSKSSPNGSFTFSLAPTKNWTTSITPGSWCVILMSQTGITGKDNNKYHANKVNPKKFKMLGRIESVRYVSSIDQTDGKRMSSYVVTGSDWGTVFNAFLYLDSTARSKDVNPVGTAESLIYGQTILDYYDSKHPLNSTVNTQTLLSFWGREDAASSTMKDVTKDQTLGKAINQFAMPDALVSYMGFVDDKNNPSGKLAQIIKVISGKLKDVDDLSTKAEDAYEDVDDGIGFISPDSVFGTNPIWSLIADNANLEVNELVTDIRFEGNQPWLALYKRIKPFALRTADVITKDSREVGDGLGAPSRAQKMVNDFLSPFTNLRMITIPKEDVIMVNAGTNWRDRYNFVEVNVDQSLAGRALAGSSGMATDVKIESQFFDSKSIGRDGFKPMVLKFKYLPPNEKDKSLGDAMAVTSYKYLAKEWYFDIHKMLNGVITMIGQPNYIQVGDNILVDSNVIAPSGNANSDNLANKGKSYLLAHVETISHTAAAGPNGARTFTTEIQFVRGVITNSDGEPFSDDSQLTLDQDVTIMTEQDELNRNNTFGTSGAMDPDEQKLRGN